MAGPWVHAPGDSYVKVAYSEFRSTSATPMLYRGHRASLYTEVGLVDGLEAVVQLPYGWASNHFPGSALRYRAASLGTAEVGLGATHPAWNVPASLRVLGRLPLFPGGGRLPFDPAPGEEQVDLDVIGAVGGSPRIGAQRGWGAVEVGWRHRTAITFVADPDEVGTGDAVTYRGQLGWVPTARGEGRGWVQIEATGQVDLAMDRAAHHLGLGFAVPVWGPWHAEAGVDDAYLTRVASPGWGFSLGVSSVRR